MESVHIRMFSEILTRKTTNKDTFYPVHRQTPVLSQQESQQEYTHNSDFSGKIGGDLFSQVL